MSHAVGHCVKNRTDADYLRFDPFGDDRDVKIECRTVKMVTTKKPHKCADPNTGTLHDIPAGTRARYEHALVDGEWGSYYCCTTCIDLWLNNWT